MGNPLFDIQQTQDNLFVEFFTRAIQHNARSEAEGRPVFVELPHVRISIPGDTLNVIERKVRDEDKQRWARQWMAYEQGMDAPAEGFPIEQWPQLTLSQVETLKALKFRTVEQLANASDQQLQKVGMGAFELRTKANAFITAAGDGALVQKQAADLERANQRIADLEAQIAALAERITDTPKRGRKPKEEAWAQAS